jgi:hypothetical protein
MKLCLQVGAWGGVALIKVLDVLNCRASLLLRLLLLLLLLLALLLAPPLVAPMNRIYFPSVNLIDDTPLILEGLHPAVVIACTATSAVDGCAVLVSIQFYRGPEFTAIGKCACRQLT